MATYVIAITGNKGAGKDTYARLAAELIEKAGGFTYGLKFASRLKQLTAKLCDVDISDLEDEKKKEIYRPFLVEFGQLAKKHFGEAVWTHGVLSGLHKIANDSLLRVAFVTDMRFQIEFDVLQDFQEDAGIAVFPIHISRIGCDDSPSDPSEKCQQLAADNFIPTLHNEGDIDTFKTQVKKSLQLMGILPQATESPVSIDDLNS